MGQSEAVENTLDKVARGDYTLPNTITPAARDLINRLLQRDPANRLEIAEVLSHRWFSRPEPRDCLRRGRPEPPGLSNESEVQLSKSSQKRSFAASRSLRRSDTEDGSNGILKDLPSFTTENLRSLDQKVRRGMISITEFGEVLIDFRDEHVLVISSDSCSVKVYSTAAYRDVGKSAPYEQFRRKDVPEKYIGHYKYAARFVDLIRSKTPRIIFYSPQAKCSLMENGPNADFEMSYYNGVKVHNSPSKNTLEVKTPTAEVSSGEKATYTTHRFDLSQMEGIKIPSALASVLKHAQECLRQCLSIEKSARRDTQSSYPIIVKSSHAKGSSFVSNHTSTVSLPMSAATQSVASSARNNKEDVTVRKTTPMDPTLRALDRDRGPIPSSNETATLCISESRADSSDYEATRRTDFARDGVRDAKAGLGGAIADGERKPKFLPNIGWLMRVNHWQYLLLFVDGISMEVNVKEKVVYLSDRTKNSTAQQRFVDLDVILSLTHNQI
ncbi:Serine/threonine-protein kinase plk4 [Irineochytrium annulatum]|nr:Serine/threonine-protein kinase plk4 [Irineochytrium annulatum]